MSSLTQMLAVLDVFTTDRPMWRTEDIAEALGYARTTAYRYIRELISAGLLQKVSAGHYALGPRVIELDYVMRQSDPVLSTCAPIMDDLVKKSGLDCVLSAMVGEKIVDTHRASSQTGLALKFGRGRPRSLFLGSSAKILLASQTREHLVKIYQSHKSEIAELGLGTNWAAFRTFMSKVRERGFYFALEELEKGLGGLAVPIHVGPDGPVTAALALVGPILKIKEIGEKRLCNWLMPAATKAAELLPRFEGT